MSLVSQFSGNILKEIEKFSEERYDKISKALSNHAPGAVVSFTLTLALPDTSPFYEEIERITKLST